MSTIFKHMNTWNPISLMIVGTFLLACFCVVWYVVQNMTPPAWLLSVGTALLGGGSFGLGGALTSIHTGIVQQRTIEAVNGKNGSQTPLKNGTQSASPPPTQ